MKNTRAQNHTFSSPFFIGTVVNNDDPEKAYRVQVRIPNLHDALSNENLPWAMRMGPTFLGFSNDSTIDHSIPENGSKILIMVVNNSPNSLLYLGTLYSKNENTPKNDQYFNNYGIYTKNGEFVGIDKINDIFHMIWNGNLTLDVQGKIKIGSNADEPAVLGGKLETLLQQMIATFNSHTHTGNLALPTSTPSAPLMEYMNITSKKITVE